MKIKLLKLLLILILPFFVGCFSKENKPSTPLNTTDLEAWEKSLSGENLDEDFVYNEQGEVIPKAEFKLNQFKNRLQNGESGQSLLSLAEELWLLIDPKEQKTKLEIGFFLIDAYKKQGLIEEAKQKNIDVLNLIESLRGGASFQEHQSKEARIKYLSDKWGDEEL